MDADRAQFSNFLPIQGTEAYEWVRDRGEINGLDHNHLHTADVPYSPPGITRRELKRLQRKAFLRFHLRPRVLWHNLRRISSFSHFVYLLRRIVDYLIARRGVPHPYLDVKTDSS